MSILPTIMGERVTLRRPKESDIIDRFKCGRSEEIVRMFGGDTRNLNPLTMEDAIKFIGTISDNKFGWCVEYMGRCIGQAKLTVNEEDRRARYAVGIFDEGLLGNGLGTEITQLVLGFAFDELKLHRVDLRVLEYNKRAIKCYEKCGFIREGLEREGAFIEGKFETDVMMSILDREYTQIKGSFSKIKLLN